MVGADPVKKRWPALILAGGLWSLLLAGYLIFNKPFALLGWPERNIFIGELALLGALLFCVADLKSAFIEPLRRSWVFRLAAAFFIYGLLRAALDSLTYGALAFRDGVIAIYALAAFLAPALWNARRTDLGPLMKLLRWASLGGAAWAAGVCYYYFDVRLICGGFFAATKPDFLTVAAAVAFWVYGMETARRAPWERPAPRFALKSLLLFVVAAVSACACFKLAFDLPTRGVQVALAPLLGLGALAWASTRRRLEAIMIIGGIFVLAGGWFLIPRVSRAINTVNAKYAPGKDLDFSLAQLEADLRKNPETYPEYNDSLNLMDLDEASRRERKLAMVSIDQNEFKTVAGERARDAAEWRYLFWMRTADYALQHAPWFGLGFGVNLTNVNRRTPDLRSREPLAWRMFLPAMYLKNRNPHSAHLTILARLGIVGLLLWVALLVAVLGGSLRQIWWRRQRLRECLLAGNEAEASGQRHLFWDGLTILGVWLIYLTAMSFGVVLENPFGGLWFWTLTGMLGYYSGNAGILAARV